MEWFDRNLAKVSEAIALYCVGALIFASMFYVAGNVIGRYLFRSPLIGMTEIVAVMLVAITYLGLSYAYEKGAYVTVDVLHSKLTYKAVWGLQFAFLLVTLTVFSGILFYAAIQETIVAVVRKLFVGVPGFYSPEWPWRASMIFGLFLLILRNIIDLLKMVKTGKTLVKAGY